MLVMDVLWAAGLFGLLLLSATCALFTFHALPAAPALGIALALVVATLAWILACALTLCLLPKPRPGTYRMLRGGPFYAWALGFIARRWLDLPPFGLVYRQSALLRFIVLRLAGARVAFSAQISSDAVLLDPGLLQMGPGALIGSGASVAGHYIVADRLVIAPVVLGAGAQVALDAVIAPGVVIGERAVVEARASVGPAVRIGERAVIGAGALVGRGALIGRGARIPMFCCVPPESVLADGERWKTTTDNQNHSSQDSP